MTFHAPLGDLVARILVKHGGSESKASNKNSQAILAYMIVEAKCLNSKSSFVRESSATLKGLGVSLNASLHPFILVNDVNFSFQRGYVSLLLLNLRGRLLPKYRPGWARPAQQAQTTGKKLGPRVPQLPVWLLPGEPLSSGSLSAVPKWRV